MVADAFRQWFPGRHDELERLAKRCKRGMVVELKAVQARHTREQQGAYWASLHELGRELGFTPHEVDTVLHKAVCGEAYGIAGTRRLTIRGQAYDWPVPAQRSSVTPDGAPRDIESYSELIDALIRFAANLGYVVQIERGLAREKLSP